MELLRRLTSKNILIAHKMFFIFQIVIIMRIPRIRAASAGVRANWLSTILGIKVPKPAIIIASHDSIFIF